MKIKFPYEILQPATSYLTNMFIDEELFYLMKEKEEY